MSLISCILHADSVRQAYTPMHELSDPTQAAMDNRQLKTIYTYKTFYHLAGANQAKRKPTKKLEDTDESRFYPRDAMLARVLAMALCPSESVCVCVCLSVCLPVCLSVCHKSVFYQKGLNGMISFSAWWLLSTTHTLSFKEIHSYI